MKVRVTVAMVIAVFFALFTLCVAEAGNVTLKEVQNGIFCRIPQERRKQTDKGQLSKAISQNQSGV